ncbi:STAS domain-containing protein [Streptomyces sp. NPDC057291]|uniref:STAS domain-containing protein n=1 Tax=Streptomyces sp. NPDC057291 TaxID=3346087 RepID=UPI00363EBDEA
MLVPVSSVRWSEVGGIWAVVVLTGEVDRALASRLREVMDALIAKDRAQIVLDLERVSFMDSAGLGTLVYGMRRAGAHGGGLRLAGPGEQVRGLLELTGLGGAIEVFGDVPAACRAPRQ